MTSESTPEYNRMKDEIHKLLSKISHLEGVITDTNLLLESTRTKVGILEIHLEEKNTMLDGYAAQTKELEKTVYTLEGQLAAREIISQALLTQLMLKAS